MTSFRQMQRRQRWTRGHQAAAKVLEFALSYLSGSSRMSRDMWRVARVAVCLSLMVLVTSCGGGGSAPISGADVLGPVSVAITPATMTVTTGTTEAFLATVNGSGLQDVQWRVNGVPGGADSIGTIDKTGNYTAPQFIPQPATVTLTAVANADNTKSGSAQVTITGTQVPARVFMSPVGTAYVQAGTPLKLSGGVIGPFDTGVVWQVNGVAICWASARRTRHVPHSTTPTGSTARSSRSS